MSMNRLRRGEMCHLHHSYFCCGRQQPFARKNFPVRKLQTPGVRIVEDVHHPRGYREICSLPEKRHRKMKLLASGLRECFYCHEELTDFRDIELAHLEPKGMGGARRDDHMDNLTLAHRSCNRENGSKRPAA